MLRSNPRWAGLLSLIDGSASLSLRLILNRGVITLSVVSYTFRSLSLAGYELDGPRVANQLK